MDELQVFNNDELGSVRTLMLDSEPWFVGKDVAAILGYSKPLNALSMHVDEDDSLKQGLIDSMGRTQETILINESGLYSLIFSSKLPSAKQFKRWVTSEVLPTLRRQGTYIIDSAGREYMTPRERLSLAKLIASAPKGRLQAVKSIVQPLLNDNLDNLLPELRTGRVIADDYKIIEAAYSLAKKSGLERGGEYIIDKDVFNEAFSHIGGRTARKILDEHGCLVRDKADLKVRTRLCLRYIDNKRARCVALYRREEDLKNED